MSTRSARPRSEENGRDSIRTIRTRRAYRLATRDSPASRSLTAHAGREPPLPLDVLIIEGEPDFLRRISAAVVLAPDLQLLGAVAAGPAALAMLDAVQPDVVLLGSTPCTADALEVLRRAARRRPRVQVLVVSARAEDAPALELIAAGASGLVGRGADLARILQNLREVHTGGSPLDPFVARRLLCRLQDARNARSTCADLALECSPLSGRETQILQMVEKGLSLQQVGTVLGISTHTVGSHLKRIYKKLCVHSRSEAVYEANQLGIL
jgi:DNA-binding NarL/FixJ family response regulator